ncbi:MAG: TonB-dependent receptor plug domain-containing protein, partial [Rhodanobacteraceae bacterium]
EVFLLGGDSPITSLTNEQGKLSFPEVTPGLYSIEVQLTDYKRSTVPQFDVAEGAKVDIAVAMESSLRVIASVSNRGSVTITSSAIDADSAERRVSQSLKSALDKIAGVSVDDTTYGPGSAFSVSLHNHDPSQTAYSIDGIHIGGGQTQLLGAAQSLFTGASVNFQPTAGYLGGTIDFRTLRPTKLWTYNSSETLGNYGASSYSFSVTGAPAKRIAIAFQHGFDARDDFRSGLTYADQSGLPPYLHLGANQSAGDLFRVSYTVDKRTSANFSGMLVNATSSTICEDFTTLVPCGYGTVPASGGRSGFASLNVNSLIGNVQTGVFGNAQFGRYGQNESARIVDGVTMPPYASSDLYNGVYYGAYASVTAKRHTDSFNFYDSAFGGTSLETYNGTPITTVQQVARQSSAGLSDKVKSNDRLALTHYISLASGTDAGTAVVVSETADWQPAKADVFEGSISLG